MKEHLIFGEMWVFSRVAFSGDHVETWLGAFICRKLNHPPIVTGRLTAICKTSHFCVTIF
jgi:hypothetical protein